MLKQTIDIARFEYAGAWFHKHLIELMRSHVLVRVLHKNETDQHTREIGGKNAQNQYNGNTPATAL